MRLKSPTRNAAEGSIFRQLKEAKIAFTYEKTEIPYVLSRVYIPDFVLKTRSGKTLIIEAKGYFRPESKPKMLAVREQHPELDIRFVFFNKETTGTGRKNIRWAKKNGFKYSVGKIPKEWLDE